MVEISITKDSDQMLCSLYKEFLKRRKDGFPKADARHFADGTIPKIPPLDSWPDADISDAMLELSRANLLRITIGGDCDLKDEAIFFMENRFKNGLKDVLSFLAQFIP